MAEDKHEVKIVGGKQVTQKGVKIVTNRGTTETEAPEKGTNIVSKGGK